MSEREVVLDGQRLQQADVVRNQWVVTVPEGVAIDDVLKKEFWAYTAMLLHPYDRVEIRTDTDEWFADLLVLANDRSWATVRVLAYHALEDKETPNTMPAAHQVVWKGPHKKWCVIRISDQMLIQDGLTSRVDALAAANTHETK